MTRPRRKRDAAEAVTRHGRGALTFTRYEEENLLISFFLCIFAENFFPTKKDSVKIHERYSIQQ